MAGLESRDLLDSQKLASTCWNCSGCWRGVVPAALSCPYREEGFRRPPLGLSRGFPPAPGACVLTPSLLPPGPKQDAEAAKQFILDMYSGMYAGCADSAEGGRKGSRSRRLFSHYTCATDTQNIRTVFKDVRDSVLARYLDEINLL